MSATPAVFADLRVPVVVAPMAGGPSTPELVAAAANAGAFGFLAGGLAPAEKLAGEIGRTRELTGRAFGVNLFAPRDEPGEPRWADEDYPAKLDTVVARSVPVVSFTFACPARADIARLHEAGSTVVLTVATPDEARQAAAAGADALCVQGCDAGGHRGAWRDDGADAAGGELYGVLAALRLVRAEVALPVIAAGGVITGSDVAAVLSGGAAAAQLGSAFLRASEAGTSQAHRQALAAGDRPTALTRAFTGRPARSLVNRFLAEHTPHVPASYPRPRPTAAPSGPAPTGEEPTSEAETAPLWAGQTYHLGQDKPAAEIIDELTGDARDALAAAGARL